MNKLIILLFPLMAVPAVAAPCLQGLEMEIENHKVVVSRIYAQDGHYSGEASVTVDGKAQDTRWNQYSKESNFSVELPGGREATVYFDGAQAAGVKVQEAAVASDDLGPAPKNASYRVRKAGVCPALTGTLPCFQGLQLVLPSANLEIQSLEQDAFHYAGRIQARVNGQPKTGRWYFHAVGMKKYAGMRIEMTDSLYYVIEFAPRSQEILSTYQEVSIPRDDHDDPIEISHIKEQFQIQQKGQCLP